MYILLPKFEKTLIRIITLNIWQNGTLQSQQILEGAVLLSDHYPSDGFYFYLIFPRGCKLTSIKTVHISVQEKGIPVSPFVRQAPLFRYARRLIRRNKQKVKPNTSVFCMLSSQLQRCSSVCRAIDVETLRTFLAGQSAL